MNIKYEDMNKLELKNELLKACEVGDFSLIQNLFINPNLKEMITLLDEDKPFIEKAKIRNHFNIIEYLSEIKKYQILNQHNLNKTLINKCFSNELALVKYLLISPHLKENAQINCECENRDVNLANTPFITATIFGKLDIVKYLLTGKELKEKANIFDTDVYGDNALQIACQNKDNEFSQHREIINFLLIDMNMELNKKTTNWLEGHNYQGIIHTDILSIINSRNLYEKLNDDLNTNNKEVKKRKI